MKVVLLQNTIINRKRCVAGDVVELEAAMAKNFCKSLLAAPYAEVENGELVTDVDPEVVDEFARTIEASEDLQEEIAEVAEEISQEANVSAENEEENAVEEITEETAEPEQEVAENKGNKKGKK